MVNVHDQFQVCKYTFWFKRFIWPIRHNFFSFIPSSVFKIIYSIQVLCINKQLEDKKKSFIDIWSNLKKCKLKTYKKTCNKNCAVTGMLAAHFIFATGISRMLKIHAIITVQRNIWSWYAEISKQAHTATIYVLLTASYYRHRSVQWLQYRKICSWCSQIRLD